jgi:hypothetical protein
MSIKHALVVAAAFAVWYWINQQSWMPAQARLASLSDPIGATTALPLIAGGAVIVGALWALHKAGV